MSAPKFRFECRRSGNCCARPEGVVRVTAGEVAAMAAALVMTEQAFRSRYVAPSGDRLRDGLGGRCPLLVDGLAASCGVYAARPEQCRTWPHWPELLASPERMRAAARVCPGIELLELPPA